MGPISSAGVCGTSESNLQFNLILVANLQSNNSVSFSVCILLQKPTAVQIASGNNMFNCVYQCFCVVSAISVSQGSATADFSLLPLSLLISLWLPRNTHVSDTRVHFAWKKK